MCKITWHLIAFSHLTLWAREKLQWPTLLYRRLQSVLWCFFFLFSSIQFPCTPWVWWGPGVGTVRVRLLMRNATLKQFASRTAILNGATFTRRTRLLPPDGICVLPVSSNELVYQFGFPPGIYLKKWRFVWHAGWHKRRTKRRLKQIG